MSPQKLPAGTSGLFTLPWISTAWNGEEVPSVFVETVLFVLANVTVFPTTGGLLHVPLSAPLTTLGSVTSVPMLLEVSVLQELVLLLCGIAKTMQFHPRSLNGLGIFTATP
jgi:hypothetical protein